MEVSVIGGQARLVMYATFTPIATLISHLPLTAVLVWRQPSRSCCASVEAAFPLVAADVWTQW